MQGVKKDLLRDVECYACGEDPSPLVMLRAPRLDNWRASVRRRGKEFVTVINGAVSRHEEYPDGEGISTGAVVWFDRRRRFVRTHNRLHALGKPAAEAS
jgi:hypothetical protein